MFVFETTHMWVYFLKTKMHLYMKTGALTKISVKKDCYYYTPLSKKDFTIFANREQTQSICVFSLKIWQLSFNIQNLFLNKVWGVVKKTKWYNLSNFWASCFSAIYYWRNMIHLFNIPQSQSRILRKRCNYFDVFAFYQKSDP